MNTKNIIAAALVIFLIILGLSLLNNKPSHQNELSRSLDRASDNIEEGVNDAKRSVKDAVD